MNDTDMYVIDLTALPGGEPREHQHLVDGIVQTFRFSAGKPTKLSRAIAVKFLKQTTAFKLTDENGNVLEWRGVPKQPEDLQAGERLVLAADETVASYHELNSEALWLRAAQLPGGEVAVRAASTRDEVIAFIVKTMTERRKLNSSSDADPDGFTPEPELDDDLAAA